MTEKEAAGTAAELIRTLATAAGRADRNGNLLVLLGLQGPCGYAGPLVVEVDRAEP